STSGPSAIESNCLICCSFLTRRSSATFQLSVSMFSPPCSSRIERGRNKCQTVIEFHCVPERASSPNVSKLHDINPPPSSRASNLTAQGWRVLICERNGSGIFRSLDEFKARNFGCTQVHDL